jgi:DNA-binding winged helix-turn-helix (wHTH) protein/Tfp pilus assembly protein PilF
MNLETHSTYEFGEFTLDLDRETLLKGEREVRLRPKCFRVLRTLVENQGRLVTKSRLHAAAWSTSVVTDDSLAHCIIEIRRAFGDQGHDMVRTVPKRGYIFEPPEPAADQLVEDVRASRSSRLSWRRLQSAAVFVAVMLGIVGFVSQRSELRPADYDDSRSSESHSVDTRADAERVTYGSGTDFARQRYLQGQFFYDRRGPGDLRKAEEALLLAVSADSSLAAAWTQLAAVYRIRLLESGGPLDETLLLKFGDAVHRALALEPDNPEALARMAAYYTSLGQADIAGRHLERAIELEPDNSLLLGILAGVLLKSGRLDEAIDLQRRAAALEPLSATSRGNLAAMLTMAGQTSAAFVEYEQLAALSPSRRPYVEDSTVDLYILEGRYSEALRLARERDDVLGRDQALAMIYYGQGDEPQSQTAVDRLIASNNALAPYHIAAIYGHRGNAGLALDWLQRARDREAALTLSHRDRHERSLLLLSPYLSLLREDGRWQEMLDSLRVARQVEDRLAAIALARPCLTAVASPSEPCAAFESDWSR